MIASTRYSGELTIDYSEDESDLDLRIGIDGQYDTENSIVDIDSSFDYVSGVDSSNSVGEIGLNMIFFSPQDEVSPKMYFRFNTLDLPDDITNDTNEALEEYTDDKTIDDLLGTWLVLDFQDLLERGWLTDESLSSYDLDKELNQEDYEEITLILTDNLAKYIFTSETENMVLEMDEFLGEEDFNGKATKKYNTNINKDNFERFLTALRDDFAASNAWEKMNADQAEPFDLAQEISSEAIAEAAEELTNVKIEVWVDSETKILRNLRLTNQDTKNSAYGSYFDVGIDFEDDDVHLTIAGNFLDSSSCPSYGYYPYDNEDCPYTYKEVPDICGEEPIYRDYVNLNDAFAPDSQGIDEFHDALDEYQECMTPEIESIKEDAQFIVMAFSLDFNTQENQINYELVVEHEGFSLRLALEVIGQADEVDAQAPSESQSVFEFFSVFFDDSDLSSSPQPVSETPQVTDLRYIRSSLLIHQSNQNGKLPSDSGSLTDVGEDFMQLEELSFYSPDDVFYFGSDFDFNDSSSDFADLAWGVSSDEMYIYAGYRCVEAENEIYTTAAEAVEEASSRIVAFLYYVNDGANLACEDNA